MGIGTGAVASIGAGACPGASPAIIGPGIIGGGGVPGIGGPALDINVIGGAVFGAPGPGDNVIDDGGVAPRPVINAIGGGGDPASGEPTIGGRRTGDPGIGAPRAALGEPGTRWLGG